MIINLILNVLVDLIAFVFIGFDPIDTIPVISGVDIDTNLVTAVGWFNRISETIWPLQIMMNAFLFILAYYSGKLILKFLLGSRAPAND